MMLPILHLKRMLPESWRSRLRFITRRLPRHWFYMTNDRRFWWLTGETEEMQKRPRLVRYELQEGCFLETYLNDQTSADGRRYFGSAACLVVHGSDILRFDCLGQPLGHYHVAAPYPHGIRRGLVGEIWLPEKTIEEQIDRTIFELQRNSGFYLQKHPRRKVRNTRLDEQRLAAVCAEMKSKMLEDVKR
ncbi:MAG: hypothetical protein JWR80_1165 [Bradyrhizobium sp.]|jgi:hypothetical protein|nr:hypothetical protein [Bradyrhizobium sp.]